MFLHCSQVTAGLSNTTLLDHPTPKLALAHWNLLGRNTSNLKQGIQECWTRQEQEITNLGFELTVSTIPTRRKQDLVRRDIFKCFQLKIFQ